jgi:hypothetical protein
MHARTVYACVRGARLYMQDARLRDIRHRGYTSGRYLGDTSVRSSLPVNVYEIYGGVLIFENALSGHSDRLASVVKVSSERILIAKNLSKHLGGASVSEI